MTKEFYLKHKLTVGLKSVMSNLNALVSHCHFRLIWKGAVAETNIALVPEGHLIVNINKKHIFFCSVVFLYIC